MNELSQKEIISIAAEAGAQAAMKYFNNKKEKDKLQRHDKRLRNTKILLSNYRTLKEHIKYAIYDAKQIIEEKAVDILDLMWEDNNSVVFVDSIKRSVGRTIIIMKHIDDMLEIYKHLCMTSNKEEEHRHWTVINALYIDENPMTVEEIADIEHVEIRTIYRDVKHAIDKLSSLIFGIDGINK